MRHAALVFLASGLCFAVASDFAPAEDPSGPSEFYKVLPRKNATNGRTRLRVKSAPAPERVATPTNEDPSKIDTTITVELLVGMEGVGLNAQEWQQVFQRLGFPVRIRSGLPGDKLDIREKTVGRLRTILLVGRLEKNGDLSFQGRKFSRSSSEGLGEWLRELKAYGSQGSPEGKPLWGLNKEQFQDVFVSLSPVVDVETKGLALEAAVEKLALPQKYPVAQMVSARQKLGGKVPPVSVELKGFSKGTALALLLESYGLGFRPNRTPEANVELAVESLAKTRDVWPVGWNPPAGALPRQVAPILFQLVTVQYDEQPLTQILSQISSETGMPIAIDEWKIQSKGIKLDELRSKLPQKQTSYDLALKRVTAPRLMYSLRVDEAQRPFVWITPLELGTPAR
jgi:hypothetical protein